MPRKKKSPYYDISGNIKIPLTIKEKIKIHNNQNKYFHDALNGKYHDNNLKNKDYFDKEYMSFVVEIYKNKFQLEINYLNKHIMYMYIMDREFENNKMVIKIGYTYHLVKRNKQLCTEFNCQIYLIGIKEINAESDEQKFHDYMMQMKKELNIPYKKKNKKTNKETDKFELYLLCDEVIKEFNNYDIQLHNKLYLEKEKTRQLEIQAEVDKEKEKTKQLEIQADLEKLKLQVDKEKEKTKQLEIQADLEKLKLQVEVDKEKEKTKQTEVDKEKEKTRQLEIQADLEKLKLQIELKNVNNQ